MIPISRIADAILASLRRSLAAGAAGPSMEGTDERVAPRAGSGPGELRVVVVGSDAPLLARHEFERELEAFIRERYRASGPSHDPHAEWTTGFPGIPAFRSGMAEKRPDGGGCPLLVDFLRRRSGR